MAEPLEQRLQVEFDVDGLKASAEDLREMSRLGKAVFGPGAVDNLDDVLEWYEDRIPDRLIWMVKISNDTDYARYLHDKVGYWVMNDQLAVNILARHLRKVARSDDPADDDRIREALTDAAEAIVDSYTRVVGRKDTDGREMTAPRPKHKGQWADDTVTLAKNFVAELVGEGTEEVADSSDYTSPGA